MGMTGSEGECGDPDGALQIRNGKNLRNLHYRLPETKVYLLLLKLITQCILDILELPLSVSFICTVFGQLLHPQMSNLSSWHFFSSVFILFPVEKNTWNNSHLFDFLTVQSVSK